MNYPDAEGKLPPVPMPVHAAGEEYLHHVTVVLPQTPDALVTHPPGDEEGFCDVGCKAFYENSCNECRQDYLRVSVKHADTRGECRIV